MATKSKAKAVPGWVAQNQDDAAAGIRIIGDKQRELTRLQTLMNDEIAEITARYQGLIAPIKTTIAERMTGVQTWCEANRSLLTNGNTIKTANLITGNVTWRINPPSIKVRGEEDVLKYMAAHENLTQFIRTKQEINRLELLANQDVASTIPGITVVSGSEDFSIEPFEQEAA